MNYRLILKVLLLFAVVLAAGPAMASERFCVTFEGLDGGGANPICDTHATWGYEYHHLMARDIINGVPGTLEHNAVIFTRQWDQIEPLLYQYLGTGATLPHVTFEFLVYQYSEWAVQFRVRLTNARLLAIEPLLPHVSDPDNAAYQYQSRIRMDYQTIGIQFENQDEVILTSNQGGH